jgi:hypothetical protein
VNRREVDSFRSRLLLKSAYCCDSDLRHVVLPTDPRSLFDLASIGMAAAGPSPDTRAYPHQTAKDVSNRASRDPLSRFLGGPPLAVLGRLVLLSVLVGVILSAIGFDPRNILDSIEHLFLHIWNMGFDAVLWVWRYFLLGAAVVVPIWFLVRLTRGAAGR